MQSFQQEFYEARSIFNSEYSTTFGEFRYEIRHVHISKCGCMIPRRDTAGVKAI